jgi:hypothetical protein
MTHQNTVSARDDRSPAHVASGVNRRSVLMNTVVSVASLASATALPLPAAALEQPDASLIGRCREALEISGELDAATSTFSQAEEAFKSRIPERPQALRWRPTDPIGNEIEYTSPGRGRLWCNSEQIEERRHLPCTREEFIGTDEEWNELPIDEPPSPEQRSRLFAQIPNETDQRRFDEILTAYDAHEAALSELRRETGVDVAETRWEELLNRLHNCEDQLVDVSATTIAGIAAKAKVADVLGSDKLAWSVIKDISEFSEALGNAI